MEKYSKLMDEIIAEGLPVHETLIKMLGVAAKYDIVEAYTTK